MTNPSIYRPPVKRFYDFTTMSDAQIATELKRVQCTVDHLATRVAEMEEQAIVSEYRRIK